MAQAVVDASVALSWVVPDEVAGPRAVRLLLAFHGNQVRLVAPSLWAYEVANALRVGVTRDRISAEEGREAMSSLLDLGVTLVDFAEVADEAWELALKRKLSIYDAAYLALAQRRDAPLYTADRRLAEVGRRDAQVRWIGEFE